MEHEAWRDNSGQSTFPGPPGWGRPGLGWLGWRLECWRGAGTCAQKAGGQDPVRPAETKGEVRGRTGKGRARTRGKAAEKRSLFHRKNLTFRHVGWRSVEGSSEEARLPEGSEGIAQFPMNCDRRWDWGWVQWLKPKGPLLLHKICVLSWKEQHLGARRSGFLSDLAAEKSFWFSGPLIALSVTWGS